MFLFEVFVWTDTIWPSLAIHCFLIILNLYFDSKTLCSCLHMRNRLGFYDIQLFGRLHKVGYSFFSNIFVDIVYEQINWCCKSYILGCSCDVWQSAPPCKSSSSLVFTTTTLTIRGRLCSRLLIICWSLSIRTSPMLGMKTFFKGVIKIETSCQSGKKIQQGKYDHGFNQLREWRPGWFSWSFKLNSSLIIA